MLINSQSLLSPVSGYSDWQEMEAFFRIAATLLVVLLFVVLLALNPKEVFGFVLAIVGIVTIVSIWSDARLSR
jgi:L-asparagine transporter-like permease